MKMNTYQDYLKKYQELCKKAEIAKESEEFNSVFLEMDCLENDNPEFCDIRHEGISRQIAEEMQNCNWW